VSSTKVEVYNKIKQFIDIERKDKLDASYFYYNSFLVKKHVSDVYLTKWSKMLKANLSCSYLE
jgi:hypothetical protein